MSKRRKIHFVGIKGVGMTPLAIIAKEAGFIVSGCDIDDEFITDEVLKKANITSQVGFDPKHVEGMDLVITTGAHGGYDNPEVKRAKDLGITVWSHAEALGEFMKGKIFDRNLEGISVAGSHGKTTTTAMIATVLSVTGLDPSFLIGTGNVKSLGSSGHYGKGSFFVAEADEYATEPKYDKKARFLWQEPEIAVITNIELDHPDVYDNLEQLEETFLNLANRAKIIVMGNDNESLRKIKNKIRGRVITYGFSKDSDFVIDRVNIEGEKMFFWVKNNQTSLGEFMLNVTGEHNALNALASVVVCLELGVSIENIKKGLLAFAGTKRRFEFIKKLSSGALLYDDYAHHPTEIIKTLQAIEKTYPDKKILCIFQPHTYSRTKKLFEQFVTSFNYCNELIIVDIYSSLRETPDFTISSELLKNKITALGKQVKYFSDRQDVVKYIVSNPFDDKWIILTMGAGDVYKIEKELN